MIEIVKRLKYEPAIVTGCASVTAVAAAQVWDHPAFAFLSLAVPAVGAVITRQRVTPVE